MLGRLITDDVIMTYEDLHSMHARKKGKSGALALKLDVNKHMIEWNDYSYRALCRS